MLRLCLLAFALLVDGCVVAEPPQLESDVEPDLTAHQPRAETEGESSVPTVSIDGEHDLDGRAIEGETEI